MPEREAGSGPEGAGSVKRVHLGRFTLEIGDPAGIKLELTSSDEDPRTLRRALAEGGRRSRRASADAARGRADALEAELEDASKLTERLERVANLGVEVMSGRLDPSALGDEIEALIPLLGRLSDSKRWQEALRVARTLALLLALIGRWVELVSTLRTALQLAEGLGDSLSEAWAEHELGTLHLIAGEHARADRELSRAQQLRAGHDDRPGLAATNQNLQALCRTLRQELHVGRRQRLQRRLRRASLPALLAITALLALVGAAGVALAVSVFRTPPKPRARVTISFAPSVPHADQSVVFTATATDRRDPAHSYTWQWGDGDPTGGRVQRHDYREAGRYTVHLTVRDAHARIIGRAAQVVVVQRPTVEDGPNAVFSFHPQAPLAHEPVYFDAGASYDSRESALTGYEWSFADGTSASGVTVAHAFPTPREYRVALTVTDAAGGRDTTYATVVVEASRHSRPRTLDLTCPTSPVLLGEAVPVRGTLTPGQQGVTVKLLYSGPAGRERVALARTDSQGAFSATAPALGQTGQWSLQAIAPSSGGYAAASSGTCPFTAADHKATSEIVLHCEPTSVALGASWTAAGAISPARANASVEVTFTPPQGEATTQTLTSGERGTFSTSVPLTQAGTWKVDGTLLGDGEEPSSFATPCEVSVNTAPLKQTGIEVQCPTAPPEQGTSVPATGSITPARQGVTVTVTYTGPNGETIPRSVTSEASGHYATTAVVERAGPWSLSVHQSAAGEYAGSSSACNFTVREAQPTTGTGTVTHPPIGTKIELDCPQQKELPIGLIGAEGSIEPVRGKAQVEVIYLGPSEEKIVDHAETDANGFYSTTATPKRTGLWTFSSVLKGEEPYEPSKSNVCEVFLYEFH